ncbi:MAG TPA: 6,7-dimethyl-8-ribityllumazine synthase [Pyrinomonadaceae bacterium]|nr:6,7-dimethyl-8-ribityllumazine synthase [Pyrinomonadaceae bacterium]
MKTELKRKEISASGWRFAIVVSRWNDELTSKMAAGARRALAERGADLESVCEFEVPGAFELPVVCHKLAKTGNYNAVIALGVVIRGDTPHFDFVAGQAAAGIMQASIATDTPIMFGVVTTNNYEQALERCGDGDDNKGFEAAVSAIEMASVMSEITDRKRLPELYNVT